MHSITEPRVLFIRKRLESHADAPRTAVFHDMPGAWCGEVRSENEYRTISVTLDKSAARGAGLIRNGIEAAVPFRMGALHRMVHQVASDDSLIPA